MEKSAKLYAIDLAEKINDIIRSARQGLPTINAQVIVDKAKNDDEIMFFYERMCIKNV
jgi:serine/threonine protein kinase HipA of HipAB toxin-antitoxin module